MTTPESAFVFNIVWTGSVFPYLRHFVASQIRYSGARFRFVANGCPPDQVQLMEEFVASTHGRVLEVFVSSTTMSRHGAALDAVLRGTRRRGVLLLRRPGHPRRAPLPPRVRRRARRRLRRCDVRQGRLDRQRGRSPRPPGGARRVLLLAGWLSVREPTFRDVPACALAGDDHPLGGRVRLPRSPTSARTPRMS